MGVIFRVFSGDKDIYYLVFVMNLEKNIGTHTQRSPKLVSLLFETTKHLSIKRIFCCELLAFILYLCSLKQPDAVGPAMHMGCELLAFILYLCSLKQLENKGKTTISRCELLAFILYLCSLKQHAVREQHPCRGCELLAFILYLCSLKQRVYYFQMYLYVVNCLHLSCIFAL